MGGGTAFVIRSICQATGLSPRGRGNLAEPRPSRPTNGSIPAWAGEPRERTGWGRRTGVYPRVGGGTLGGRSGARNTQGLSPRGRGNPPRTAPSRRRSGSIPAWAGEPHADTTHEGQGTVYPRVGGGTLSAKQPGHSAEGLSPRGRGNQPNPPGFHGGQGSIPAWAGEPG